MNSTVKTALLWVVIIVLVFLLWSLFQTTKGTSNPINFSQFIDRVNAKQVEKVTIRGDEIHGEYKTAVQGSKEFHLNAPANYPQMIDMLKANGVSMEFEPKGDAPFITALITWAPVLFLIGLWIFFMRQMQAGGNKALSFGKSKAKLLSGSAKKVTFKDVAGVDEAKLELHEIIEFLKEPQKFTKLGGKIPKGVLLMGPPGTGKTLLARAIAGEANVPFFSISGSDFVEMFVGVGASRVRDLFEQGKKNAPCIIFIDEIDAVGRHRGAGLGGGHDEREQTLNQLLVEMDGFESNEGVILIAGTNRPDVLDPALLRPGRFDRRVVVDLPDLKGREGILRVHTRNIPLAEDVDLPIIARGTPGFSGADIANLVNEAALNAARYDKKKVQMVDFEFAKDKVLMGVERKSMMMSDREKRNTAYHESGHTIVAAMLPAADPLHKVTIIPRGRALGLTQQLPTEDKYSYSKRYLDAMLAVLMGGRIAEEVFMNEITTGAGNDIERATGMARKMVCEWGMSDLGPATFGKKEEAIFLGREFAQHQDYSEATAIEIDKEVRRILDRAYKTAHDI
ncbi:MAG TPA: ATP-dependent zinc metalloprotease FtsH, partial [Thermoanaerobaculia bacterium]|nr:ATP-dependent zinc metalloprotease FtsH [Thermoanaerobaculia bacterium]